MKILVIFFLEIGCFKGTFSFHLNEGAKTYQTTEKGIGQPTSEVNNYATRDSMTQLRGVTVFCCYKSQMVLFACLWIKQGST